MPLRFAFLLLSIAGASAATGKPPEPAAPVFTTLYRPDGSRMHLTSLFQDTVTLRARGAGPVAVHVDHPEYVILVVSHTECEWTRRLLTEMQRFVPGLRALHVRLAAVFLEKAAGETAEWLKFADHGIPIFLDRDRKCFPASVKKRTPSIQIFDHWGTRLFAVEGYVDPARLVSKIQKHDFAAVPPGKG